MLDGVGRRLNEQGEEKGQKSMRANHEGIVFVCRCFKLISAWDY